MREIIFRGKRMDNGEWVEGYLYEHEPPLAGIVSENDVPEPSKWFVARTGFADWNMPRPVEFVEVDPSTVGQYTGLEDKHGEMIFEGDIIKRFWMGAEIIYCVRYDGENAHFIGKALNKSGFTTFDGDGEMFEVIGNVHDNPELIKDEDET